MISVELSGQQIERLRRELRRAGNREIGGVMVAENLGEATFRLSGFSVQRTGGGTASFVRKPALHRRFMGRFFEKPAGIMNVSIISANGTLIRAIPLGRAALTSSRCRK